MRPLRAGFTLFEALITIAIIAVVAMAVAPTFSDDARLRLMAASSVMASDIEFAQVRTIAEPESAVVVRFDAAQARYWLAPASTPETPITRGDTGEPYLVEMGIGRAGSASGVTFTITDIADDTLAFNAQGGLEDFNASPRITLSLHDVTIMLQIAASTGSITETSGP